MKQTPKKEKKMPTLEKPTANQVQNDLNAHQLVCAERYKNIEKRLDSGAARFARIEGMIIGLYGLLVGATILERLL